MLSLPARIQEFHPPTNRKSSHAVQFYENDAALIENLGQHTAQALTMGNIAIVIATGPHRAALAEELALRGFDAAAAALAGRYMEFDAAETVSEFMAQGVPNKSLFEATIGALVRRAAADCAPSQSLVLYGEMVALLWTEGKKEAAVVLEQLWNDLAQRHTFQLLCGYPINAFDRADDRRYFFQICGEHTQINPAEDYPHHGTEKQRRGKVVRLQPGAKALETEIRIGRQRLQMLQKTPKAGSWELDIVTDTLSFSSAAARLLGFEHAGQVRLSQLMDLMYYSGDRESVAGHLLNAQRHRSDFTTTFRITRGDETRIIQIQGKTFYNSGNPMMLGVFADVTPSLL
jgi:PAS domain-containing protein